MERAAGGRGEEMVPKDCPVANKKELEYSRGQKAVQ